MPEALPLCPREVNIGSSWVVSRHTARSSRAEAKGRTVGPASNEETPMEPREATYTARYRVRPVWRRHGRARRLRSRTGAVYRPVRAAQWPITGTTRHRLTHMRKGHSHPYHDDRYPGRQANRQTPNRNHAGNDNIAENPKE